MIIEEFVTKEKQLVKEARYPEKMRQNYEVYTDV